MALTRTLHVSLGLLAFVLGVIAEHKKPAHGTPIQGKGVVICQYPADPSILLGSLAAAALSISALLGLVSVFYPYNGKQVPTEALFRSTTLLVFFALAAGMTVLAEGMMMWATVTEGLYRVRNVHHHVDDQCPTAKTGLFGGAAFMALNAFLLSWVASQILTMNARDDYLESEDSRGDYGQILAAENDEN